jgi:hypothetical protein
MRQLVLRAVLKAWSKSEESAKDRKAQDGGDQFPGNEDACQQETDPKRGRQSLLQLHSDKGNPGRETEQAREPPGMRPGVDPGDPREERIA